MKKSVVFFCIVISISLSSKISHAQYTKQSCNVFIDQAGLYEFCKFLVTGVHSSGDNTNGYSNLYMKEDMGINEEFPDILTKTSDDMIDNYAAAGFFPVPGTTTE